MSNPFAQRVKNSATLTIGEYFSSGSGEEISPFLTSRSRLWAKNLSLKVSIVAAILLTAAFVLSFFPTSKYISYFLQALVYFLVGVPALIEAIEELSHLRVNIHVLMVVAAFLSIFIHSSLEGGLLLVLFSMSHSIEHFVVHRAKSTLNNLSNMAPTQAVVLNKAGKKVEKSVKDVQVGDTIFVKQGEMVPLDGKVIEGSSSLNVSHITGEHIPIDVEKASDVVAGAMNLEGLLKIEVTKTGSHSTISRIIQLICEAHNTKPKLQSWFDKFGQIYSIFVIVSSVLFATLLPLLFPKLTYFGIEGSIYRALAYLIAASPCALIIAVPIAYISSINCCAKLGIILKGGLTLDTLAKVKAIAFDKTGTLTSGTLDCTTIKEIDQGDVKDLNFVISIAKGLEEHAVHPIAKAIVDYAEEKQIEAHPIKAAKPIAGSGIEGRIEKDQKEIRVAIGNLSFVSSLLDQERAKKVGGYKSLEGNLVTALLIDQEIYILEFLDHLRAESASVVNHLKSQLGLKVYILSGDNESSVKRIASELNVDKYFAHLLPEDKLKLIEQYSKEDHLAMVGDGINDTPALARAAIGISMGHIGGHMATEVAEVVLIKNDLSLLQKLFKKAKDTLFIVKQNVFLASIIILGISIPALFGFIPLWLAVICHEGGTVLVGLNGLRLLRDR